MAATGQSVQQNARTPEAANDNARKARIGTLLALLMITVAVIFDGVQFVATFLHVIPVVGNAAAFIVTWYVGIVAQFIFFLWFTLLGASTNRNLGLRMLVYISTFVSELVPLINALPAITLGVIALILLSRAEERFGDLRNIRLSQLRDLMKTQVPLVRAATKMSNPLREVPTDPNEDMRQQGAQREYKKQQLLNAEGEDIAGYKYFDIGERYKQQQSAKALRKQIPTHEQIQNAVRTGKQK